MMQTKTLICAGILGVLMGCGGESTPEPMAPEPPPADIPAAPPADTPPPETSAGESAGGSTTPEPAAAPAPAPLTDEQIAAVTDAANTGEVEQAKLAQKKGKHARVKKFAGTMIAQHGQAKTKQAKLLGKLKVTPAENSVSTQLTQDSTSLIESLKSAVGADFDKAYIDAQIAGHKKVLETFDTQLIPNVKNAELKAALEEFRPKLEAHLKEAQDIQALLAALPPPAEPAAKGAAAGAAKAGAAAGGGAAKPGAAAGAADKAPKPAPK